MAEQHGKTVVLLLDQYDISPWFFNTDEAADRDKVEVSAYGDNVKQYVAGLADGQLTLSGNYDGGQATSTIDGILAGKKGTVVNALVAPRGDLTPGFEAVMMAGVLKTASVKSSISDAVKVDAMVHGGGPYPGIFIQERAAFTVTGNGASVDNTVASTAFGGRGQLHVTTNSMNNTTIIKVQDSADNSAFADILTFATVGAAGLTSEHKAMTGTVRRYLRVVRTAAGTGSITFSVAFWRGVQ